MKILLVLLLLLPAAAAAEDGVSVEYLAAPENEMMWYVESWHGLPQGWRLEPSLSFFRSPHGSSVHRTASVSVGWEPTRRLDLSVTGGWTALRDGYSSRHAGASVLYVLRDNVKAGPAALFTSHMDNVAGFTVLESALSVKVAAQAARSRWTFVARKSLYDRALPSGSTARYGGAPGGALSTQHHSPTYETLARGFNDASQSLRWDPELKGPVEFFLQYERSTYTNRATPAHEYQGGFLWDLGRTGFGLTLRRFDARAHHATDALIFEWRLKLS